MDYSPWFDFWESEKRFEKRIPSQGEQNGAKFSSVAPSSEGIQRILTHSGDDLYHARTIEIVGVHNSSLEGAMKLKFAPFCSS